MIYFDNHATTPLDPVALQAMLPLMQHRFANAGSITHSFGRDVAEQVSSAIESLASMIGASEDELVITSGATESNNLALLGTMLHPRQKRRKLVSVVTEHKATLDPLKRLTQLGFEVQLVAVHSQSSAQPGMIDLQQLAQVIDDQTALVSVMLANNEIGVIQPMSEIASLCRKHNCWLHTDATQAVGRIPVNVDLLGVDLLSFSAHKFYGPKGVGGLFVRRRDRAVRLQPQIIGGGQQHNLRSGTLNTAGIVGMHAALNNTLASLSDDRAKIRSMRDRMFKLLLELGDVSLNGPPLGNDSRLEDNLNCCFYPIEGQSLMMHAPDLAVSSGSACTSANPEPSHVLRALGLSEDQARSSLRFGFGKFNTPEEVDRGAQLIAVALDRLRSLG
jgi:cysteine desulfurase